MKTTQTTQKLVAMLGAAALTLLLIPTIAQAGGHGSGSGRASASMGSGPGRAAMGDASGRTATKIVARRGAEPTIAPGCAMEMTILLETTRMTTTNGAVAAAVAGRRCGLTAPVQLSASERPSSKGGGRFAVSRQARVADYSSSAVTRRTGTYPILWPRPKW